MKLVELPRHHKQNPCSSEILFRCSSPAAPSCQNNSNKLIYTELLLLPTNCFLHGSKNGNVKKTVSPSKLAPRDLCHCIDGSCREIAQTKFVYDAFVLQIEHWTIFYDWNPSVQSLAAPPLLLTIPIVCWIIFSSQSSVCAFFCLRNHCKLRPCDRAGDEMMRLPVQNRVGDIVIVLIAIDCE